MKKIDYPRIVSLFVALIIFAGIADAETIKNKETKKFRTCMANVDFSAMKNSQWLNCYMEEFQRQDELLKSEYQKLISRIPDEAKPNLIKAQKVWNEFRDQWCKFEETLPMAPNPYVNQAACLVEITIDQKNKIKDTYPNYPSKKQ